MLNEFIGILKKKKWIVDVKIVIVLNYVIALAAIVSKDKLKY